MEKYPLSSAQTIYILSDLVSLFAKEALEENVLSFTAVYSPKDKTDQERTADSIEKAWNHIVFENDAFRLGFQGLGFWKKQYVTEYQYQVLERDYYSGDMPELMEKIITEKKTIPWTSVPMWKGRLYLLSNGQVLALFSVHHALIDGYSFSLVFKQLSEAFDCYFNGSEPIPQKRPSILDYLQYDREFRKTEAYKENLRYWFRAFNTRKRYRIPGGRPSLSLQSDTFPFSIEGDEYRRLTELAGELGISLPYLFQCLIALTTKKITGCEDFAIYSLVHGRMKYTQKQLIGTCMSDIPLFFNFAHKNEIGVSEYIQSSYGVFLEEMKHSMVPTTWLLPVSYKEGLFNGFNFNHTWFQFSSMDYAEVASKTTLQLDLLPGTAQAYVFYLSFLHYPNSKIQLLLDYQVKRFSRERIESLVEDLKSVIEQVLQDPNKQIGEL